MFWTVYKGASELDKDWVETDQSTIIAIELLVGWRFLLNSLRYIYEPIIFSTSVFSVNEIEINILLFVKICCVSKLNKN